MTDNRPDETGVYFPPHITSWEKIDDMLVECNAFEADMIILIEQKDFSKLTLPNLSTRNPDEPDDKYRIKEIRERILRLCKMHQTRELLIHERVCVIEKWRLFEEKLKDKNELINTAINQLKTCEDTRAKIVEIAILITDAEITANEINANIALDKQIRNDIIDAAANIISTSINQELKGPEYIKQATDNNLPIKRPYLAKCIVKTANIVENIDELIAKIKIF